MTSRNTVLAVLSSLIALVLVCAAGAQPNPVKWSASVEPADTRAGEYTNIKLTTAIEDTWHMYSIRPIKNGPVSTSFVLPKNPSVLPGGKIWETPARVEHDPNFDLMVGYHAARATFTIPVKLAANAKGVLKIKVAATYQLCNESTCLPPATDQIEVTIKVAPGKARPERAKAPKPMPEPEIKKGGPPAGGSIKPNGGSGDTGPPTDQFGDRVKAAEKSGLFAFMYLAFGAGLLALLTPCVFPMIPITVSFFTKAGSVEGAAPTKKWHGALAYSLGIIGTFTGLGLLITLIFGATGVANLATNPWLNLAMALLFIVLAFSLFGLFEIALPAGLVNKFSGGRTKAGWVGPMLMGLTFTLTSFTCTVPFVGTILAAAAQGNWLFPIAGMFAFSTAFALPFFFLALFPQYLAHLPKSGGWLATIKAFMGFLELAAAVKFVSNADLVWNLGWITKPVFLATWAVIAALSAVYLLGGMVFPHESKQKIGWARRGVGAAMLAATVYCMSALEGAPLGDLAAFMPPDPYPGRTAVSKAGDIKWLYDYDAAITQAKSSGKPVFVNFTGVTCTNCRWMEKNMFTRDTVKSAIGNHVAVELFTDRGTPGDLKNKEIQQKLTGVVSLPTYVIVDPDGTVKRVQQGSTRDESEFLAFLNGNVQDVARR